MGETHVPPCMTNGGTQFVGFFSPHSSRVCSDEKMDYFDVKWTPNTTLLLPSVTRLKFNSSILKSYWDPKGKDLSFFRGHV